jgi:hypothetical protein
MAWHRVWCGTGSLVRQEGSYYVVRNTLTGHKGWAVICSQWFVGDVLSLHTTNSRQAPLDSSRLHNVIIISSAPD